MATYAICDIQGCFIALQKLLDKINFDSAEDILWFTGDLVNRWPQSLETLRFINNLGTQHHTVLGNHDLHLLALAHDAHSGWPDDTLTPILKAHDRDELINWLCQQPLLHHDDSFGFTMVHAGLAPSWDLKTAKQLADEVVCFKSEKLDFFVSCMEIIPDYWDEAFNWNGSFTLYH